MLTTNFLQEPAFPVVEQIQCLKVFLQIQIRSAIHGKTCRLHVSVIEVFAPNTTILELGMSQTMFYVHSCEAKSRVFEFNCQEVSMFQYVR